MADDALAEADDTLELAVEEIDGTFVPRPIPDVSTLELDGEIVLGRRLGGGLQTFCLNRTGGIVWSCFDGEAPLDELIDDFSDVFAMPREVVAEDVLNLTRQLGMIGLLEGLKPVFQVAEYAAPTGLPIGSELPPAELTGMDGTVASLESFRGGQMLLVNWSPFCGFCERIGADLAAVQGELRGRGVELVLVALGDAEPNRELLERHGLECTVLLQRGTVEAFYGLGTPCAYLIDDTGKVASALAVGADQVPLLARQLAGS